MICSAIGFLVGGIPFGYLLGHVLLKDDIRNHGSGNIGATNVARVVGWKWGAVVLLLDALKGLLPTWGCMRFAADRMTETQQADLGVLVGISAILGHMYPVYLKLRGGKGVATALGVVIVLAPRAVAVAVPVFAVIFGATRVVALASIIAALAFGGVELWLLGNNISALDHASQTAFAVGIPLLIVWRHRSNIVRLIKGTEQPLTTADAVDNQDSQEPG